MAIRHESPRDGPSFPAPAASVALVLPSRAPWLPR